MAFNWWREDNSWPRNWHKVPGREGNYLAKCLIFFYAIMTRVGLVEGAFDSRVDLEELHAQAERSR